MKSRAKVARQLQRAVGDLTKVSLARMEREMPWVNELPAEHRAGIGMVLQAGYNTFISWYREPDRPAPALSAEVFGNAPRSLTGVISLQQTVAMIRLSIDVAEAELAKAVDEEHQADVRMSILRYGRELAFATADVYAHAAETRGAWDARLEALVVDSVVGGDADETVRSRASALGWGDAHNVAVLVGRAPRSPEGHGIIDKVRQSAQSVGLDALGALHGDRLVVVVGGVSDADKAGAALARHFGDGPVVVGPVVADLLRAHASAAEAAAGLRAADAWPSTPTLVTSEDLLAERALDGDRLAHDCLVEEVYEPLLATGPDVVDTLTTFLDQGGSIEGTARMLFVHPNTVRYRLRRVLDVTGLAPGEARHAFTLRIAVVLGRLAATTTTERSL